MSRNINTPGTSMMWIEDKTKFESSLVANVRYFKKILGYYPEQILLNEKDNTEFGNNIECLTIDGHEIPVITGSNKPIIVIPGHVGLYPVIRRNPVNFGGERCPIGQEI